MRSVLAIASIHECSSKSIDFVSAFTQDDLGVDVILELPLGMVVGGNRG